MFLLVPRLCLGTPVREAPLRHSCRPRHSVIRPFSQADRNQTGHLSMAREMCHQQVLVLLGYQCTLTLSPAHESECVGRRRTHTKRSFEDRRSQAEPGNERNVLVSTASIFGCPAGCRPDPGSQRRRSGGNLSATEITEDSEKTIRLPALWQK